MIHNARQIDIFDGSYDRMTKPPSGGRLYEEIKYNFNSRGPSQAHMDKFLEGGNFLKNGLHNLDFGTAEFTKQQGNFAIANIPNVAFFEQRTNRYDNVFNFVDQKTKNIFAQWDLPEQYFPTWDVTNIKDQKRNMMEEGQFREIVKDEVEKVEIANEDSENDLIQLSKKQQINIVVMIIFLIRKLYMN